MTSLIQPSLETTAIPLQQAINQFHLEEVTSHANIQQPKKIHILSEQLQGYIEEKQLKEEEQQQSYVALTALFYKSYKLQSKNYCSNVCQIFTPLLCILFTLAVRQIAQGITSGAIDNIYAFPQPFYLPYAHSLIQLGLSCEETYYYQFIQNSLDSAHKAEQPTHNNQALKEIFFNQILKVYCQNNSSNLDQQIMPEFIQFNSNHQKEDSDKILLNEQIMKNLYSADHEGFERGVDLKANIPDGLIKIKQLTKEALNIVLAINDWRLPQYHKNNGVTKLVIRNNKDKKVIVSYLRVTEGMMSLIEKVYRSYLQLSSAKEVIMGSYMYMPFDGQDKSLVDKIINMIGSGLYPLGLSLLIPLFLFNVVSQKEDKLIEIMKMNGLNINYYWINFFLFNFTLSMLTCLGLFLIGKYLFIIPYFSETNWLILWSVFITWSIAQISLTSLVQIFIDSSKSATIIGYLLSIFSTLIGETISGVVYPLPSEMPLLLLFYPPFALCRALKLIGYACANHSSCFKQFSNLNSEYYRCIGLLGSWLFMFIFSIWLNKMVQQQYGHAQDLPQWMQNIVMKIKQLFGKNEHQSYQFITVNSRANNNMVEMQEDLEINQSKPEQRNQTQAFNANQLFQHQTSTILAVDSSVQKHAQQTNSIVDLRNMPLVVKQLSKKYVNSSEEGEYIALKPTTFCIREKEIFGLLGPNGAGKTTLISVLTGMYAQSSGNAFINGLAVGSSATNKSIGVCPQFDLLWKSLTISEHMTFYAKLKNIGSANLEEAIAQSLRDVDLLEHRDLSSSELSGGMQRRLSLAISLIGNPKLVFLDEPSSGLDPSHRRQMWNILLKCKQKTSILLTTHLMEEAEVLCDQIAIINQGLFRCIGTKQQLKEKYGKGYRLIITYKNPSLLTHQSESMLKNRGKQEGKEEEGKKEMESRPKVVNEIIDQFDCEVVNELHNRVILKVEKKNIIHSIRKLRLEKEITWLVSQPSLYDVFMHFIN